MGVVECMCSLQKELDLAAAFCFVEATRSGVEEVVFELHHNPQNAIIADKTIQRATFPYRPSNSFHYIVG